MNEINIRKANREDIPAILDICKKIWEGRDYIIDVIDDWFSHEDAYHFVLEYDGKITHFERLKLQSGKTGWMEGLRGDPDYRGKGLAKKLSQYIIDYARSINLETLRAVTYFKNDASIALTIRVGYKIPYRFLLTRKEIDEIKPNNSDITKVRMLKEDEIDQILKFLDNSRIYNEKYKRFIVNTWYYEEHSKEKWLELIRKKEIYTINNNDDKNISSLMALRRRINRDGYVVGFLDSDDEDKLDVLFDYAEYRAIKDKKNLSFVVPQNSNLVNYQRKRGYEPREDSDGNVLLFELDL